MKTVRISDDVYEEIAKRGKFGENVDDVLRRVFGLSKETQHPKHTALRPKSRIATVRMTARVSGRNLLVEFENGQRNTWALPDRSEKDSIRRVRDAAVRFAEQNGATLGQMNAVKKSLTDAGYHLTKS